MVPSTPLILDAGTVFLLPDIVNLLKSKLICLLRLIPLVSCMVVRDHCSGMALWPRDGNAYICIYISSIRNLQEQTCVPSWKI